MHDPEPRQFSFYTPIGFIKRLDRIREVLQERIAGEEKRGEMPKLSRSYVFRAAAERGMKSMESELGLVPPE